ncbi:hypothetical protein [Aestuariirhabdus sp. LZHN29]|uniref:hypothetical protein n=1 Tax=Aestuariirhabdus sp. LZHN29 TaxID=3417462 RepID=UPI003CEAF9EC
MKNPFLSKLALAGAAIMLPVAPAMADETYVCTQAGMERIISVVYTAADSPVPCDVVYQKDGEVQTLWHADSEQGYCERNAEEFVERQRNWGWECTMTSTGS